VARPRAADDFAEIRARVEELRRDRAQMSADKAPRFVTGPRPYSVGSGPAPSGKPGPAIRRILSK
jgi:hypothetical protein